MDIKKLLIYLTVLLIIIYCIYTLYKKYKLKQDTKNNNSNKNTENIKNKIDVISNLPSMINKEGSSSFKLFDMIIDEIYSNDITTSIDNNIDQSTDTDYIKNKKIKNCINNENTKKHELINDKKKIGTINNNERDLNIKCIDSHDKVIINNDIKFTNDSNKYDISQNNDILNIDSVLIEPNNKIFNSLHYDNMDTPINNKIIVENTNTDKFISSNKNNDGNNSIILNIAEDNNETHENINEDMFIDSLITIIGNNEDDLSVSVNEKINSESCINSNDNNTSVNNSNVSISIDKTNYDVNESINSEKSNKSNKSNNVIENITSTTLEKMKVNELKEFMKKNNIKILRKPKAGLIEDIIKHIT